jgi:6-phosphogluconolactonase
LQESFRTVVAESSFFRIRKLLLLKIMNKNIRVAASGAPLVSEIDRWVQERLQKSIKQNGIASIALAGGSTPKVVYQALATADFAWDKLHVFWGDERFVPPTDPDSNEKMARENWLNLVPIPAANIHPWPTTSGTPEQCAALYADELTKFFPSSMPSFDLVLLGMGEDGHTASLFPHTAALGVMDRSTAVGEKDGQPRLTLTVPAINNAACVAFIITGAGKRPALKEVMATTADAQQYPSRLIKPIGELWWWLDESAAADLNGLG